MKSKLDRIIECRDNIFVEPDGTLNHDGFVHHHRKSIAGRTVYFDSDKIHDYNYVVEKGVILPDDEEISAVLLSKHKDIMRAYNPYSKMEQRMIIDNVDYTKVEGDENQDISFLSTRFDQRGGGQLIEDYRGGHTIGRTFLQVGGMRYTFGLEFESHAGRLTADDVAYGNASIEGDRTINAYEYVTNVLSGDEGLKKAMALGEAMGQRCLISDGNGLHIHIGGHYSPKIWTPSFNRLFSINAIKLGAQIESDMLALLIPKRRKDKYLKSVKPWGNIDGSNWRATLGDFVFKGSENPHGAEANYRTHALDDQYNSDFKISRWAKTKHKWMNLNHCNASSHVNTIEFRLYSSTGKPDKVKNFILISLAIVWFIENKQRRIWEGGVTLSEVITAAYYDRKQLKVYKDVMSFILERKNQFKRK